MNMVAYRSDQTPSGAALGLKGKLLMMNKTSRVWPLQGPASFTSKAARMLYLPGPLTCFCHAPSHLSALADASFLADCFVLVAVPTVLIQSFSAQWRSPPLYSFTNSPLPGKTEPLLSFIFYVFFFFLWWNTSQMCVSSLRRGQANLCIIPIWVHVLPKRAETHSFLCAQKTPCVSRALLPATERYCTVFNSFMEE